MEGWAIVRRVGIGVGVALLLTSGGPLMATCSGGCGGYQQFVMDTLRACPKARELLGDDIHTSYVGCACGQMETGGGTGHASWSVPVSGSRGSATYDYILEEHAGRWQMMAATLETDAQKVDVLACVPPSPAGSSTGIAVSGDTSGATELAAQCDANVAASCLALGAMYEEGKGVPRDEALARKLYDRACQGGLATGCALRDRR